jgi:hypothetical protein
MNFLNEQETARLREAEREAARPSPRFLEVVSELADKLGLDAAAIAGGSGVVVGGIAFNLVHYGRADDDGLTLIVHMGELPAEGRAAMLRPLLEFNVTSPGPGVYGLIPGTDKVVFRMRIDLVQSASPADEVLKAVAAFSNQLLAMAKIMASADDFAQRNAAAAPAP